MSLTSSLVGWLIEHVLLNRPLIFIVSTSLVIFSVIKLLKGQKVSGVLFAGVFGVAGLLFGAFHKPVLIWLAVRYPFVLLVVTLVTVVLTVVLGRALLKQRLSILTGTCWGLVAILLWLVLLHYWTHIQ